jgi:hypothetical protein
MKMTKNQKVADKLRALACLKGERRVSRLPVAQEKLGQVPVLIKGDPDVNKLRIFPHWTPLKEALPPLKVRLLIRTQNPEWVGFLYLTHPWAQGHRVNLYGPELKILATYTSEITHWLNLDELLSAMNV